MKLLAALFFAASTMLARTPREAADYALSAWDKHDAEGLYSIAHTELLGRFRASGHLADQPILSVKIPRSTLEALNLPHLDASDSMRNFLHNMEFKKTKGFAPVAVIGG